MLLYFVDCSQLGEDLQGQFAIQEMVGFGGHYMVIPQPSSIICNTAADDGTSFRRQWEYHWINGYRYIFIFL